MWAHDHGDMRAVPLRAGVGNARRQHVVYYFPNRRAATATEINGPHPAHAFFQSSLVRAHGRTHLLHVCVDMYTCIRERGMHSSE
jgi:hypothetical protein